MNIYKLIEGFNQASEEHNLNADDLVAHYLSLRDAISEERQEFEAKESAVKDVFKVIEDRLRDIADAAGLKSLPTTSGTAYRTTETHVNVSKENWGKFVDYVRDNDAFELIQKRVSKLAVLELLEHNSKLAPEDIGLTVTSFPVINVRRS